MHITCTLYLPPKRTHRLHVILSRIICIMYIIYPKKPVEFSHERSRKSARYLSSLYTKNIQMDTVNIYFIYIYSNMIHPTSFLLGHGGRVEKRDTRMVPRFLCRYILSNDFHLTSWPGIRVSPSFDTSLTLLLY